MVCPDLRAYGGSTVPPDAPDHAQASKRAMAADVVALMDALGHGRFAPAGHDRGGYVAFRAALDHPDRVAALTTFGRAVPILETLERMDARFAREWWHWFFLGQTGKPAEKVIAAIGPDDLRGTGIDSGHHVAEEAPEATARGADRVLGPGRLDWRAEGRGL